MSETPTPRTDACEALCPCGAKYVDSDVARNLERALTAERAALQAAQEELREDSAIRERMASLLSATAIALKGQEGELQRHGWHDLPDIALKIKLACDISEVMLQDERAARERAEAENATLRGLLGNSAKPCAHCGLPVEQWGECAHGFPGCARADDAQLSDLFAVRAALAEAEAGRVQAEAEREALLARSAEVNAKVLDAAAEVLRISDRKHEAWDQLRAALAELERGDGKEAAAGVQHDGCNYLAPVGHVCNKCGQVVRVAKEGS